MIEASNDEATLSQSQYFTHCNTSLLIAFVENQLVKNRLQIAIDETKLFIRGAITGDYTKHLRK